MASRSTSPATRVEPLGRGAVALAAVGTALLAAGLGVGVEWLLRPECVRVEGPSPGPEPGSSAGGEDRPPSPCAEIVGRWHFKTLTTWAKTNYGFLGVVSDWSLDLESIDGCDVVATLSLDGTAYKRGSVRGTVTPHGGQLRLAAEFVLPAEESSSKVDGKRSYQFTFEDDHLDGGWRLHNTSGAQLTFGVLEGGRQPLAGAPEADLLRHGCTAQCWTLCGSESAAKACVASECTSSDAVVTDCGAPAPDFQPPGQATSNLGKGVDGVRAERSAPGECLKAALALRGRWELHEAAAPAWMLTLGTSECELRGTDDEGRGYEGTVDARGGWILRRSAPAPSTGGFASHFVLAEAWSFMGWGPALGVHSNGANVVAYRK